jgi:hypothetical protein
VKLLYVGHSNVGHLKQVANLQKIVLKFTFFVAKETTYLLLYCVTFATMVSILKQF